MEDIVSAHRVFINTEHLYEMGKVGSNRKEEVYESHKTIVPLPSYLKAGDTLDLLIHVSNFHHSEGGILRQIKIGSTQDMQRVGQLEFFLEAFQMGGVAVMGIFFLVYFLFRGADRYHITFSFLCLGILLYVFFNGDYVLYTLFQGIPGTLILDMVYISFYFGVTLNYLYLSELFPTEIPHWSVLIVKVIGVIAILTVLLLPMHLYSYSMPVFQVYAILSGLYLLYCVYQAMVNKRPGAKITWTALIIIYLFMINDLLYNAQWIDTGEWIGWGGMIYLMLLMVVTSRRFSAAISNEEQLLKDLRRLNESLAFKVQERTEELESKSAIIKEQQERLSLKNEELLKAREEEKALLKTIVHDMKSPFNRMLGLISVFKMETSKKGGADPEEINKIFQMVETVAKEGSSLIEDLNALTFFDETLEGEDKFQEADLIPLLEDLILGHQGYATRKDIGLQFECRVKKYPIITHRKSLIRIIDNLLSNAIKFSPPGTTVTISVNLQHETFEILIKDEGPGFTPEDRVQLFAKFKKLSARPTSGESSTGLGLNIVKTLTEGLGGTIRLLDEEGGAHFVLTLPRKPVP
jgi:signal transduction histidine kinase